MGKAKRAARAGSKVFNRKVRLTIKYTLPTHNPNEWRDHLARWGERAGVAWVQYKRELPSECLERLRSEPAFAALRDHLDTLVGMAEVAASPKRPGPL